MTPPPLPVRASDSDRARAVEALQAHHLAGRLTAAEFERRVELAYAATTRDELDALTQDLPRGARRRLAHAPEPSEQRRKPWLPGQRSFHVSFEVDMPSDLVTDEAMRVIAPRLINYGYRMEPGGSDRLVFTLGKALWPLAAVLIFPFGLIGLFFVRWDDSQVVLIAKEAEPGRTIVDVYGVAPLSVRRAMFELERSA